MRNMEMFLALKGIPYPGSLSKWTTIRKSLWNFTHFAFVLVLLLIGESFATHHAYAAALYSCGGPSTGHCYAVNNWSGSNKGSRTNIFTNQLNSGDCFVNNEMWDSDGTYWVEAGFQSDLSDQYGMESVFWADNRPNGGGYTNHAGDFLSGADFGKASHVDIHKIASDQFSVSISGLPYASLSGTSTANPIGTSLIQVGLEMCGSASAGAPKNGYSYNQYQDANNGSWKYQTIDGTPGEQANPARGYFTVYPHQAGSNGGQWTTCIVGNSC